MAVLRALRHAAHTLVLCLPILIVCLVWTRPPLFALVSQPVWAAWVAQTPACLDGDMVCINIFADGTVYLTVHLGG